MGAVDPGTGDLRRAAEALRAGRLVVFPTETVYGLGANALDSQAVARIFAAKGRPADNPLIVHIEDLEALSSIVDAPPEGAYRILERFAPGPITLVLPRSPSIPDIVTAGLDTVAVRIPSHPLARELIRRAGLPIAAPSANRSGRPSPTDADTARRDLGEAVAVYLDGGPCTIGLESTVARFTPEGLEILREGAITQEMLQAALRDISVLGAGAPAAGADAAAEAAASPGTRHAHYMPRATVVPFQGRSIAVDERRAAVLWLSPGGGESRPGDTGDGDAGPGDTGSKAPVLRRSFATLEEYAQGLYKAFRDADVAGCEVIFAELPVDRGLGRALRDRILRAAGSR